MIYIVTGKLGAGKSLLAVQRMIDYAAEGRKVASNFEIDFSKLAKNPNSKLSQSFITVLPSIPTSQDLISLGDGGKTEDTAGALVLDECGAFLNSRTWNDNDRHNVITWLLHARKRKWDVFLIVQHERMLDKQIRDALAEYVVTVRRTDRMKIPFTPIRMPRMHIGIVRYGLDANSFVAERWITRGSDPMLCYNTHQIFSETENGAFCTLPAATINAWYSPKKINYTPTLLIKVFIYIIVKVVSPSNVSILTKRYSKC